MKNLILTLCLLLGASAYSQGQITFTFTGNTPWVINANDVYFNAFSDSGAVNMLLVNNTATFDPAALDWPSAQMAVYQGDENGGFAQYYFNADLYPTPEWNASGTLNWSFDSQGQATPSFTPAAVPEPAESTFLLVALSLLLLASQLRSRSQREKLCYSSLQSQRL